MIVARSHKSAGVQSSISTSTVLDALLCSDTQFSRVLARMVQPTGPRPEPPPKHTPSMFDIRPNAVRSQNQNTCLHARQPDQQFASSDPHESNQSLSNVYMQHFSTFGYLEIMQILRPSRPGVVCPWSVVYLLYRHLHSIINND